MFEALLTKKHVKYLERHLSLLPSKYQEHEPNKLAIVSYALIGQCCLGEDVSKKYEDSKPWLESHYKKYLIGNEALSGFIPCLSMDIDTVPTINLPNTLFALWSLICLNDNEFLSNGIDRASICRFVSKCQVPHTGAFVSSLDPFDNSLRSSTDSTDLRYCYIAVEILYLMGCRSSEEMKEYIDVGKLLEFITSQCCPMGGFGQYGEAHAGYTSCALSALELLKDCWHILDELFISKTIEWLIMRQVSDQGCMALMEKNENYDAQDDGGFQGRENKYADTCYAFWCLNSLNILNCPIKFGTAYQSNAIKYLLEKTQDDIIGGFAKTNEDDPDLYHTCLGLATIGLVAGTFSGSLFLPKTLVKYLYGHDEK